MHDLRAALRSPQRARDLLRALGVSQPTLSRLVASAGRAVHRIGRARATTYALAREVRAVGGAWPAYRIDERGRARRVARLVAIQPGFWWDAAEPAAALLIGHPLGVFPDWPWFLDDLRPGGFMGRSFARRHAEALGLPADPRLWSADGTLVALLQHGDDLFGDLVLGEQALAAAQRRLLAPVVGLPVATRRTRYEALAAAALSGDVAGSSALGEQPKFTTRVSDRKGELRHVLVKFAEVRGSAAARRWADLLVCEHLAAQHLAAAGVSTSRTEIVDGARHRFLEVTRFDRVGKHGRRGIVSLQAVDAEHHGRLDDWARSAERLRAGGWLAPSDAEQLLLLWCFGRLIANTDMHFGNASLFLRAELPWVLAPTYDMLPMGDRPAVTGAIEPAPSGGLSGADVAVPPPERLTVWQHAAGLAAGFWREVAAAAAVSPGYRRIARSRALSIERARDRLGSA